MSKYLAPIYKATVVPIVADDEPNPVHQLIEEADCIPIEFEISKRGWFLYKTKDGEWHRILTSPVIEVHHTAYSDKDYNVDLIEVETRNTLYTFKSEA